MRSLSQPLRTFWHRNDFLIICAFIAFSFTVYHRLDNVNFWTLPRFIPCDNAPRINNPNRFVGNVNQEAGVPNIVHYIRFGRDAKCFTSEQANSLLSVVENHAPFRVYIHTDDVDSVQHMVDRLFARRVHDLVDVRFYPHPKHVFGLNFSDVHRARHAVDFTKLKVLRRYGGIYLENNVRVFRNLRKFLNYEITIVICPRPERDFQIELTDDVLIAHKDARFLNLWLRTYHEYNQNEPKHSNSTVMQSLLRLGRHYVHVFQQDLPANLDANDDRFRTASNSKENFFVTTKDNKAQCL